MKLIAFFALVLSLNVLADTKLVCKGINGSEGSVMTLENKSSEDVPELTPIDYLLFVKEGTKVVFNAVVTGKQEDVQLFIRSRRGAPYVQDVIFMDELYDVNVRIGNKDYNFNCEAE